MATGSLLALLDDIASILDDVSVMTKLATKKTVGVLGDDLALNAQQVTGVKANRELPVVWAVAKGSLLNKAMLVPIALLISYFAPWGITPLLMVGGAFLCYEGVEKLAHKFLHPGAKEETHKEADQQDDKSAVAEAVALEKGKIKGAIRTDFVLSAEIIAITLGVTQGKPFLEQFAVLAGIAILLTVGVYGLVAAIVKLDDVGLFLSQRSNQSVQMIGRGILYSAPWLMKGLSIVGTAAMFLVGGGILVHGLSPVHHAIEALAANTGAWNSISVSLMQGVFGIVAGIIVLAVVMLAKRVIR